MWRNGSHRYGLVSISFHWAIALAFVALVGLGAWMVGLSYYDPWYNDSLALHKAIGIVALALAVSKFGWRFADPRPGLAPDLKPHERAGATVMHGCLNALIVLVPVTGYVISTSEGAGIDMFGLFELPAVLGMTEALRDLAIELHYYLAYAGIALVAVHAGAALKHHFIDKGSTLKRMLNPRAPSGRRG